MIEGDYPGPEDDQIHELKPCICNTNTISNIITFIMDKKVKRYIWWPVILLIGIGYYWIIFYGRTL